MLRTAVARPALALRTSVRHFSSSSLRAAESGKDPQLGDYPDLPFVSLQRRKYSPKWFDPQEKRNYGETVRILGPLDTAQLLTHWRAQQLHEQDDYLSVWAPDAHAMPASSALRQLLFVAGVFAAAATAIYVGRPDRPSIPRVRMPDCRSWGIG